MGVAFQSMQHLDIVQVTPGAPVLPEGDDGNNGISDDNRPSRSYTGESWDEHQDQAIDRNTRERRQRNDVHTKDDRHNIFQVGAQIPGSGKA